VGQIRDKSNKKPKAGTNPGKKTKGRDKAGTSLGHKNTNSGQIQQEQIENPHKSKQQKLKAGNNVETTPKFTNKRGSTNTNQKQNVRTNNSK